MAKQPRVGIVLAGGSTEGSGGTGRRFARIFRFFQQQNGNNNVFLLTYGSMLALMRKSLIDIGNKNVLLFKQEPCFKDLSYADKYLHYLKLSRILRNLAYQNQIDILHFTLPYSMFLPFLFLKNRITLIFSMTAVVASLANQSWKTKLAYRIYLQKVDIIDTLYSDFAKTYPIYRRKTRVSPCSFTDYTRFYPSQRKQRLVVFAGRLEPFKNPLLFLETALSLSKYLRQKRWQFIILGKGELEEELRTLIHIHRIGDIVSLNAIPDTSTVLNKSSIFVSLQQQENYPSQSLLEAMAAGNAIIAADVGETRRLANQENAILIKEQSANTLSQAILALTENRHLIHRLGENARMSIINTHRIDIFAEYLQTLWLEAR